MLLDAYRRTGADPPFGDPRRDHGSAMEGYYWRIVDPAGGRVVMVLCGVCAAPQGRWAAVALARHPERLLRTAIVPDASADPRGLGVRAGDVLDGDEEGLRVDLGPDARLDVRFADRVGWPYRAFGGLGPAHVVPGLVQYWHPHLLGARVQGSGLDGALAYAEKNWGPAFAPHWWWGQAFFEEDVCAAFAGGPLRLLGHAVAPTAVVVRLGASVLRLAPPLARVRAGAGGWHVRARSPRWTVEVEGEAAPEELYALPVPVPGERATEPRSRQALAGHLALTVRCGRRTVVTGDSLLAGLERG
jgi:Tocopherol cyclase